MKAFLFSSLLVALFTGFSTALPIEIQSPQVQPRIPSGSGAGLGVYLSDVADSGGHGAVIERVIAGSAAAEAGLKQNDVVQSWNGTRVESSYALVRMVGETPAGRRVNLGVLRDRNKMNIDVTLKAKAEHLDPRRWFDPRSPRFPEERQPARPPPVQPDRPRLGIQLQELNPQLARFFGLENGAGGVLVASVFDDSPAKRAGIQAGDVITGVNGTPVANAAELGAAVNRAGDDLSVTLIREGKKQTIDINPVAKRGPAKPSKKKPGKTGTTI